jgi:hypothetical protein
MKKIFTLLIYLVAGLAYNAYSQVDAGTGVAWGSQFFPSSNPVLIENFQGFRFFHSDENPDQGNSNNLFDTDGVSIIYGYKNDSTEVPAIGNPAVKFKYTFYQCAFAPEWKPAFAFKDGVENTPNVTNGFVEVSRDYSSTPPTVLGYFGVDLYGLDYIDGLQGTHSSCGGNKRGVLLLYSTDNGTTWDTLRYQGSNGVTGFTKDITTGLKTLNIYNCQPSAYGMTWEDGIYYVGDLKLRFSIAGGQVPRIHDLIVYGDLPTSASIIKKDELKIVGAHKMIRVSEPADIEIYTITGSRVRQQINTNEVNMQDATNGIYIVKAIKNGNITTKKITIQ